MAKKEKDKVDNQETTQVISATQDDTQTISIVEGSNTESNIPVLTLQIKDRKREPNSVKIKYPLENSHFGTLVSRLDYTVSVEYNGSKINVPPRAVIPNLDKTLLGTLPKNLDFKSNLVLGR